LTFHGKVKIALSVYCRPTYLTFDDSIAGQVDLMQLAALTAAEQ
jgi:hypothetical protein